MLFQESPTEAAFLKQFWVWERRGTVSCLVELPRVTCKPRVVDAFTLLGRIRESGLYGDCAIEYCVDYCMQLKSL